MPEAAAASGMQDNSTRRILMSSIMIQDLPHNAAMDSGAMLAVRGGSAVPDVNVNVTLDQQIGQFQQIGVNVLNNNGVIGAGFAAPSMDLAIAQWSANRAGLPKL
jgi:hypothetical protein